MEHTPVILFFGKRNNKNTRFWISGIRVTVVFQVSKEVVDQHRWHDGNATLKKHNLWWMIQVERILGCSELRWKDTFSGRNSGGIHVIQTTGGLFVSSARCSLCTSTGVCFLNLPALNPELSRMSTAKQGDGAFGVLSQGCSFSLRKFVRNIPKNFPFSEKTWAKTGWA